MSPLKKGTFPADYDGYVFSVSYEIFYNVEHRLGHPPEKIFTVELAPVDFSNFEAVVEHVYPKTIFLEFVPPPEKPYEVWKNDQAEKLEQKLTEKLLDELFENREKL